MAKTPKPKTKKKPNGTPPFATYTLKQMDRTLWSSFTSKCQTDGREVKWVMLRMIRQYANGELRIDA